MKAHLLCIPCTLRAAYDIATKATSDEVVQRKVLVETIKWLNEERNNLMNMTPTALHTYVFKIVQRFSGNTDPFAHLKDESNRLAMELLPLLEGEVNRMNEAEAFRFAALGAICGNSIDFEVEGYHVSTEDLKRSLLICLKSGLTIDDSQKLMDALSKSRTALYFLDNAGEVVFDKLFIKVIVEKYPVKIFAAVKSGPILNDATMKDALEVGLSEVAEVIEVGSDSIGLNLEECSEDFKKLLKEADLIIAKGQGYYESLTEVERVIDKPITYMLRAKCSAVAKSIGVPRGSNVIKFIG